MLAFNNHLQLCVKLCQVNIILLYLGKYFQYISTSHINIRHTCDFVATRTVNVKVQSKSKFVHTEFFFMSVSINQINFAILGIIMVFV
jgi:hypothetical protein